MIRTRRRHPIWLVVGLGALLLGACRNQPASPTPTEAPSEEPSAQPASSAQQRTFDALWSTVDENYLYDDFGGVDWQAARDKYRPQVEAGLSDDEFAELVRAMLAELPADTASWQSRAERIEAESGDPSRFEGIGAFVSFRTEPEPRVLLLSVMPGSPAERAGLEAHDTILAIDGDPLQAEAGLDGAIARIRGPAGSDVTLEVRSPGRPAREVEVTRGSIASAGDALELVGTVGNGRVGYFLLPTNPSSTLIEEVLSHLQALNEERELDGLILDLRIASSGAGWPLGEMLVLFGDGNLGTVDTRSAMEPLSVEGQDQFKSQSMPLAIIVGPDTRGSPEIFAAALQAVGRATVVGLPTQGLVEGVGDFALPDGSTLSLLTTTYRTPRGRDIGELGVRPNVMLDVDWDSVTPEDDPVRNAALAALDLPAP
jgi:C-terminal peptidase prc